ncbi:MAG TPA: PIG-L family deacetylase [Opitutaceae bacterium]|nr:PIG-L family deacetylase [Opitutaceae bacterium]
MNPIAIFAVAAALAIGIALAWAARRWRRRERRLFPHGRAATGCFIPGDSVLRHDCAPGGGKGVWILPRFTAAQSGLLTFAGVTHGTAPELVITANGTSARHDLLAGWRGHWSVDATPAFRTADAAPISLRFHNASPEGCPSLLLSSERPGPQETLLVLAPHPDDAELAAFGLYASCASRAFVATCTAGERGTGFLPGESASVTLERALRRARESLEIPVTCGGVRRERVSNFLLPDGSLEALLRDPRSSFPPAYDRVRAQSELRKSTAPEIVSGDAWIAGLRDLLERTAAEIVVCPDPLCDNHPDHRATAAALAAALSQSARHRVRAIYLYTIHATFSDTVPLGVESMPCDPPPLLRDVALPAFYSQSLDRDLQARKRKAVVSFSDFAANSAPALARGGSSPRNYLRRSNPTDLARRCWRSTEWFRVVPPAEFVSTCPLPPSPS